MTGPIRLALAGDYPEERWPSMDLVGAMVLRHLRAEHAAAVAATPVCPPFRRRFGRPTGAGAASNADRVLNRFWDYPRAVARRMRRGEFDLLHVVDHSYAQLVPAAGPVPAVVTCHDLDAFRCLLEPAREPRPAWFRALARRILAGFRAAAAVVCVSEATCRAVRAAGLVPEARLHVVPNGIPEEFGPDPDPAADAAAARLLGGFPDPAGRPELLHVGLTIPRKRIDVLLEVVARLRRDVPGARLVKVGAELTPEQRRRAEALGLAGSIVAPGRLERPVLAAVYRRAALVLQPSEAEGFGLPVAEALACGAAVLASDLDVLREVGGSAADYAPVGAVDAWAAAASGLLERRRRDPVAWAARRTAGIARAGRFRWSAHVARLVAIYRSVLDRTGVG